MHDSLWTKTQTLPEFPTLEGDLKTDVLIIGGGICGLLCAYFLKQRGVDCVVVEANRIAGGVTENTTGKVTALHGLIYSDLAKNKSFEVAQKYYHANSQALASFEKIAKHAGCDWQTLPAYTYSLKNREKIEKEYDILKQLNAKALLQYQSPLPISFSGAVGLQEQGQFHPLKFLNHICQDLTIFENTRILNITPHCASYDGGKIKANAFVVATHFPFLNRHGMYFLKLYQHRSYLLALEHAQPLPSMYLDEAQNGLSFRNHGDLLLLGGGGGRTGKPCGNYHELQQFQAKYYPGSNIYAQWATQDCISLDKIPLIGQYSPHTPNLYVATGFNKWGMTSSMVAAQILSDKICQKENDYADIFAPNRNILHPQLLVNGLETLTNFLYPTTRRCPHLGCALKWNPQEHSWDCSCHGSRFASDGKLINNPANKNL